MTGNEDARHHPTLCATSRNGCWVNCSCGWGSALYTTTTGAHLSFGDHLTAALDDTRGGGEDG